MLIIYKKRRKICVKPQYLYQVIISNPFYPMQHIFMWHWKEIIKIIIGQKWLYWYWLSTNIFAYETLNFGNCVCALAHPWHWKLINLCKLVFVMNSSYWKKNDLRKSGWESEISKTSNTASPEGDLPGRQSHKNSQNFNN